MNAGPPIALVLALLFPAPSAPQDADSSPAHVAFEVASVRENVANEDPSEPFSWGLQGASQFRMTNVPVRWIIAQAYDVGIAQDRGFLGMYRLVGGPERLMSTRFDILAKMPDGATMSDVPAMLRSLLAERFNLKVHGEKLPSKVYRLTPVEFGRLGPGLRPSEHDCVAFIADGGRPNDPDAPVDSEGRPLCLPPRSDSVTIRLRYAGPMAQLVKQLQPFVDRLVVDDSGRAGTYEWHLEFANPLTRSSGGGSVFTAVREQLGLRLEPRNDEPAEIYVVDSVEMPTPN